MSKGKRNSDSEGGAYSRRYLCGDWKEIVENLTGQWEYCWHTGDYRGARFLVECHDLDPNTPTGLPRPTTGLPSATPLAALALADKEPAKYPEQIKLARALIKHGAELTVFDVHKMLPADWALMSRNQELAFEVYSQTIQRLYKRDMRLPYTPNIDGFLVICADHEQWQERFGQMRDNHSFMQMCIKEELAMKSPLSIALHTKEKEYWRRDFPRKEDRVPRPSLELYFELTRFGADANTVWLGGEVPGVTDKLKTIDALIFLEDRLHHYIMNEVLSTRQHVLK